MENELKLHEIKNKEKSVHEYVTWQIISERNSQNSCGNYLLLSAQCKLKKIYKFHHKKKPFDNEGASHVYC